MTQLEMGAYSSFADPASAAGVARAPARRLRSVAPTAWEATPRPATRGRREHWSLAAGDATAASLAAVLGPGSLTIGVSGVLPGAALPLIWVVLLTATRNYERRLTRFGGEDLRRLARAGAGLAFTLWLLASLQQAVRPVDVLAMAATATVATAAHRTVGALWSGRRAGRVGSLRVVLAGHHGAVSHALAELRRTRDHDFEVAGVCLPSGRRAQALGVPTTAGFANLAGLAAQHAADAVIVLPCHHFDPPTLRRLGWHLEKSGTQLFVGSGLVDVAGSRTSVRYAGSVPLLHVRPAELSGPRRAVKEACERVAAGLTLLLLAPLFLALVVAVRRDSSGRPCSGRPGWGATSARSRC